MLYARLTPRIRQLGLGSFRAYVQHLNGAGGDSEIGFMVNALTTNLTRFFREPAHLDHLRDVTIPQALAAQSPGKELRMRIWSAGCATGEEPYSIAMVMRSCLENSHGIDAKILATDLDTAVLEKARTGLYPFESTEKIPELYRKRYIQRSSRKSQACRVHQDVRRYVSFKYLNLLNNWPMRGPFDAIFCRNVMIYFDPETKAGLVERYCRLLKPGGFLYLGHSETLMQLERGLERAGSSIYRKID